MDKNSAKRLIQETLQNPFDKTRFRTFIVNLLNHIDENKAFHARGHVKEMFKQQAGVIKTYERLGTYTDPEGKKLDVIVVYLEKSGSIDKARATLRNFAAHYLKQRDEKDAGLFAFVSPDMDDWRFSFVKMEYNLQEVKGKIRPKAEFTPAKRYSFLVGKNESSHTAQNQFVSLLEEDSHNPTLAEIEGKFNIEVITKEFFTKYRELFLDVKDALEKTLEQDHKIKEEFAAKFVDTADFAKKLLGQIVFLYFLQKKGWFGVERDSEWGTGPKNFLRLLYQKQYCDYKNFFNDILEPLFYNALAIERPHDWSDRFNCKIPFLNGGLFDPIRNYDWVHTDIELPNELFHNDTKTKEGDVGTGILDIFDRYNFTVKEDEPLEKEVAVDPEMLGKVFENLLEVKDRKSKGTYYTPREIVHYMCEQSLINYLATELDGKVSKEDLEQMIKFGENVAENEATYVAKKEDDPDYEGPYKQILPPSIEKSAREIDEKLASVKVCDPAIGSGAFPVGMMSEIVKARNVLSSYIKDRDRTVYGFKRDCIQNSLYGVDIDPGAVEIAKLRLWLSLIVDEEDIKEIKPLPNLDYKIMQGNSLLEEYEGVKLFDEKLLSVRAREGEQILEKLKEKQLAIGREILPFYSKNPAWQKDTKLERPVELFEMERNLKQVQQQIKNYLVTSAIRNNGDFVQRDLNFGQQVNASQLGDELKLLHRQFFEESSKSKKDEIKKRIGNLEWKLIEATLKEQGKTTALKKLEDFKKSNARPFFLWKLHFAEIFQDGGFDIIIANPPYVFTRGSDFTDSFKKAVKKSYFCGQGKINLFSLFIEKASKLLKAKGVYFYIIPNTFLRATSYKTAREFIVQNNAILQLVDLHAGIFENVTASTTLLEAQNITSPECEVQIIDDFTHPGVKRKINQKDFDNPEFVFSIYLNKKSTDIIEKIRINTIQFESICKEVIEGIVTPKGKNLFISDKKESQIYKPFLEGKDIDRYQTKWKGKFIKFDRKLLHRPRPDYLWNSAQKILIRRIGGGSSVIVATLDSEGFYTYASINNVLLKEDCNFDYKFILALLNSKLINWFYVENFTNRSTLTVNISRTFLDVLPLINISLERQKPIISLVDKILAITKTQDYSENTTKKAKVHDLERQIDDMVYKLYGLTKEDIKIVGAN